MPPQIDFDPGVDYYKTLGVESRASADDIKRAYRKLAKQFHPDSTGGDKAKESRFKDVQVAYDVLGDAKKKQLYDDIRAGGFRGVYAPSAPSMFDLGDLFSEFIDAAVPPRGARVHVDHIHFDNSNHFDSGSRFAAAADAEFESRVQGSDGSWLHVEGRDVYSDVRISFDRAMLGTTVQVVTIDGQADVKIPSGTSSGKRLRLRGKGIGRGGRFAHAGDHYVTVQIDVPTSLDEEAKKILAQLIRKLGRRE